LVAQGVAIILELEPRAFPNWHFLLQLLHDPLTCLKAFAPIRTRHSQKKGGFSNYDKTNPVMDDNELEPKSLCSLFGNSFQLVLGHFPMRIIIDSLNLAAILDWPDYAAKINNRTSAGDVAHPRRKRRLCQRNFTNGICHALKLLATVIDSELSCHKRRYKNEYESM
jgi:hypothetical protein